MKISKLTLTNETQAPENSCDHSCLFLNQHKPHADVLLSLQGPGLEVVRQLPSHLLLSEALVLRYNQIVKVHLKDYLLNHNFKENNLELPKRKQHIYLSAASPHRLY